MKEIDEATLKCDQLYKIHASLEADYVKFIEMAESKMGFHMSLKQMP